MNDSSETCARDDIQAAVDLAANNKERVRVVCDGQEIAAVVPLEDLELLEELEDRSDLIEALDAIAEAKREGGTIPWQ
ncbi:MAG: prevent-host-death family protein [Desulfomonile tiedjei]|nr:prevent-host-death family protein [Desulfomonile tiedjei]